MEHSTAVGCSLRIRETGNLKQYIMKIDFTKFPCYNGIKRDIRIEMDIAESLANAIYINVQGIAASSLAHKIYSNKGEVNYDEREVRIIRDCTPLFSGVYADSINDYLDTKEKEEQE